LFVLEKFRSAEKMKNKLTNFQKGQRKEIVSHNRSAQTSELSCIPWMGLVCEMRVIKQIIGLRWFPRQMRRRQRRLLRVREG
jgi:hypothetical protein